jgi:hypothetical protein
MEPTAEETPKRKRGLWLRIALYGLLVIAAVLTILPYYVKSRVTASPNACINNLLQIDGAKEQWALEHKVRANDPVNETEVESYIKGGKPICPGGGTYTYGPVDANPVCSIKEHTQEAAVALKKMEGK